MGLSNMKKISFKFYLLISALIFGFAITIVFKANLSFEGLVTIQKLIEMEKEIKNNTIEGNNLIKSTLEVSEKIKEYESGKEKTGSILDPMKKELKGMQMIAGLKPTYGPGIIIVLNDSDREAGENDNLEWFLIHDIDVLEVVNELRASGAEEISINDERVMPNTSIRCGGPTILIDGKRHATPYVIKAIGDPKALEASVLAPDSYIDLLEYNGIRVSVQKVEKLVINSYIGPDKQKYLKIVEGGETK